LLHKKRKIKTQPKKSTKECITKENHLRGRAGEWAGYQKWYPRDDNPEKSEEKSMI